MKRRRKSRGVSFQLATSLFMQWASGMFTPLASIGNHDFCPWANKYVYWLKQPIGWFVVGAAAALLVAVFLAPHAWIMFGSLVVVMLLGVAWPSLAMRGATAEIIFDCRRCRKGDRTQVRLAIHNHWPWPLYGLAITKGFLIEASDGMEQPVASLARVPGWSRSEFLFEFQPPQRGIYPYQPPVLTTGFPFGIWQAHRLAAVQRELLVWPRTTPLTSIPSLGGDIADVIGMLFDRPGHEGDTIGVRPFRQGDRLRSIHWAQTVRRESFIVTERQAAARRLVVITVDAPAFATGHGRPSLEAAIRVAASVAQEFHAHHAQVRFVLGNVDLMLEPGLIGLHRLLDALARFHAGSDAGNPRKEYGRDALTLIVTSTERKELWQSGAGTRGTLRFVLIDAATREARAPERHTWLALSDDADCPQQLRRQWERVCHDSTTN
ncbi:MAG: DUF58 domain-containing protein [Pirellulaceae bacterium]